MSEYSVKNYTEQGGDVTHIGGKLVIDEGGEVEGFDGGGGSPYTLPIASADTLGGVKAKTKSDETVEVAVDEDGKLYVPAVTKVVHVENSTTTNGEDVTDLVTKFNSLLSALQTAGLMAAK